jgi:hypothetical protein
MLGQQLGNYIIVVYSIGDQRDQIVSG